ncbi:MAG: hypothetical protein MZV64_14765 [Ignavibacteriales bacterium]|nr:hypothetical protein [Ignavibacteriales bacterium]
MRSDPDVLRILGEDPLVRLDGLVEGALLGELGRLGDDLVLVDCHRAGRSAYRGDRRSAARTHASTPARRSAHGPHPP